MIKLHRVPVSDVEYVDLIDYCPNSDSKLIEVGVVNSVKGFISI